MNKAAFLASLSALGLPNPSGAEIYGFQPGIGWVAIVFPDTPVAGESNTASTLGTGTTLVAPKNGVDLPFRSLLASAGLAWSQQANTVTLSLDATLQALGAVNFTANTFAYATGADSFSLATVTPFARTLLDDSDAAAARATLGLGSAAVVNLGVSGDVIGKLNTANAWSLLQTFSSLVARSSPIAAVATTAKTLALADAGVYQRFTNAGASILTVPTNAAIAFSIGAEVPLRRTAATNLTISPAAGVTINAPANGTLVMTNRMSAMLKKVGTDEWDLIGQTVPA